MRFYVKWLGESALFLLVEQAWNEAARKRVAQHWWVHETHQATSFLSLEDAWKAFDKSGAGSRESYTVEPHS